MKKNFKLVLALVLSIMMIAGMIPAMADNTHDPQIKITGLAEGDVVHLYKVIGWVGEAAGNVSGWAATDDFSNILDSTTLASVLGAGVPATGITATMAGNLARAAVTAVDTSNPLGSDGEYTYNVATPGMYMAMITPADPDTVYNPVFVSSDYDPDNNTSEWAVNQLMTYTSADGAAKKSQTDLDKTADTSEDAWDDAHDTLLSTAAVGATGELHWTTTAIGDTVDYTVETTIPGYGNTYQHPEFILRDKLEHLTLTDAEPVVVGLTKGNDYTISVAQDKKSYTITFTETYLHSLKVPTKVKITYRATVDANAPLNVNPQTNEVSTEFSHIPTSDSDHNFKKDTTQHYTFSLDASGIFHKVGEEGEKGSELVKTGIDAAGNPVKSESYWSKITNKTEIKGPLEGATFGLFVKKDGVTGEPTKAEDLVPYKGNDDTVDTAVTTSEGRMTFSGLDAGTYYLMETQAPTGYVKSTEIVKIVIEATVKKVEVTEWTSDGVTWYPTSADGRKPYTYETEILQSYSVRVGDGATTTHVFTNDGTSNDIIWSSTDSVEVPTSIPNVKGVELPHTGGIGTTIFYVGGSLLVLAAAILLITKRRMSSND